jgi:hypothetical protein
MPGRCDIAETSLSVARYALFLSLACALSGCTGTQERNPSQSSTNAGSPGAPGKPGAKGNAPTTGSRGGQAVVDPTAARPALEAWAKAFNNWADGTGTPQAATARPQRKAVYVDVMAVARRHPAWQLAEALERNEAPVRLVHLRGMEKLQISGAVSVPLASPRGFRAGSSNIPGVAFSRPEYSRLPVAANMNPLSPFTKQAAQRVTASGLNTLQEYSRQRQRLAIENFLKSAEQRSEIEIENRALDLRGALEENITTEVEALQRRALAPGAPTLPSPAVQLEMTNLRLRLQNARLSEAERGQAQSRLNALESQWREELRAQENTQLAQLEQSRRELPLQRRREGTGPINQELAQLRNAGQSERQAVRERLLALLGLDFGQDDAALGIVLPAIVSPLDSVPAALNTSTRIARSGLVPGGMLIETPGLRGASGGQLGTGSNLLANSPASGVLLEPNQLRERTSAGRAAQIRALRAQAIREAWLWTRIVARRQGWQLQEKRLARTQPRAVVQPAPRTLDGTGTVLRILNFA